MNWQNIYSSEQLHKAEIVKSILESKGLNPVIINKSDRAYKLGHYEVHVSSDSVIIAIKIINDDIRFT